MSIVLQVAQQFPPGTSVAAYQTTDLPTNKSGAPSGAAVETQTVASDGTLTYTTLAAGTEFVSYAVVSGRDRYVEFRTREATSVQVPLSGATSGQAIDAYTGLPLSVVSSSDGITIDPALKSDRRILRYQQSTGKLIYRDPYFAAVKDWATGDAVRRQDGAMTNGSAVLTAAGASFAVGDVGKYIAVEGAGAAGAPLVTTILSRDSATQVTLSANASATVSSKNFIYGTDDTAAFQAAHDSGLPVYVEPGNYMCGTLTFSSGRTMGGANGAGILTTPSGASRIYLKPMTNGPLIQGSGAQFVKLADFKIDGLKTLQTVAAPLVKLNDVAAVEAHWTIDNLTIVDSKGSGLYIGDNNRGVEVFNTYIYNCDTIGIDCQGSDTRITDSAVGVNASYGISFSNGAWNCFAVGNNIWGNLAGLRLQGVKGIWCVSNLVDNNLQHGLFSDSCTGVSITSNTFIRNSAASDGAQPNVQIQNTGQDVIIAGNSFLAPTDGSTSILPSYDVFCGTAGTFIDGGNARGASSKNGFTNAPSATIGGKVPIRTFVEYAEQGTDPTAVADRARLWARDDGNGATQLCARFGTGDVKVLAAEGLAGQRQHIVSALQTPKATTGTWTYLRNNVAYFCGYINNSGTSAQNDDVTFYDVWLDAGTWQLDLFGLSNTDGAQVAAALIGPSGTLSFSGTQEQYAASSADVRTAFAGIAVGRSGLYTLKCTATNKNASSSSYRARISAGILTRTA